MKALNVLAFLAVVIGYLVYRFRDLAGHGGHDHADHAPCEAKPKRKTMKKRRRK